MGGWFILTSVIKEILESHRERIARREKLHGRKADYQTVVEDLTSISKGLLIGDILFT